MTTKPKKQTSTEATESAPEIVVQADAPSFGDLPDAFAAVDEVTTALASLCENLQRRFYLDPQKRGILIPVVLATGEYRDRLMLLLSRMDREGFFEASEAGDKQEC